MKTPVATLFLAVLFTACSPPPDDDVVAIASALNLGSGWTQVASATPCPVNATPLHHVRVETQLIISSLHNPPQVITSCWGRDLAAVSPHSYTQWDFGPPSVSCGSGSSCSNYRLHKVLGNVTNFVQVGSCPNTFGACGYLGGFGGGQQAAIGFNTGGSPSFDSVPIRTMYAADSPL